jgi:hypothetical protein
MKTRSLVWLQQLARACRRGLTRRGRPSRRRPALEVLETRTVPAVYRVTGFADGLGLVTPSVTPGVNFDATTLRAAVIAANASVGVADTIILPGGTYHLTLADTGGPEDTAASGDLDITDNLTIASAVSTVVIDATGLGDRVFKILPSATGPAPTVSMNGLTIQGGQAPVGDTPLASTDNSLGGGILNEGSLTLTDCVVQGNLAQGAAFNDVGSGNGGNGSGGGIFTAGPMLSLIRTQVLNNRALGGSAISQPNTSGFASGGTGAGGGIACPFVGVTGNLFTGTITLTDSTVSDNLAALALTDSTVSSNRATNDGGGIRESVPESITLHNDTITANVADSDANGTGDGGGVWSDGSVTAASTIIAGNFDNTSAPRDRQPRHHVPAVHHRRQPGQQPDRQPHRRLWLLRRHQRSGRRPQPRAAAPGQLRRPDRDARPAAHQPGHRQGLQPRRPGFRPAREPLPAHRRAADRCRRLRGAKRQPVRHRLPGQQQ